MGEIGLFLCAEEHPGDRLVRVAREAEAAGLRSVLVSDRYHPWLDSQGHSPFVWAVIGGIAATTRLRVSTGITCPTGRVHPAVVAQAAATAAQMLEGRFQLGVGSGDALDEHILGGPWPPPEVRLEMLEEAIAVIRALWRGEVVTHHGRHYRVEGARLRTRPDSPPPVLVSGAGAAGTELAARIGDGFVTTRPDADALRRYRRAGGTGQAVAAMKVCWGVDEADAVALAHRRWRSELLAGELARELPTPDLVAQACELVSPEMVARVIPCGPDPQRHASAILAVVDAGYDQLYLGQVGDDQEGFLAFWEHELRRRVGH